MDGYIILSIFFGVALVLFALFTIKKDIEKGEKIILQSEDNINRLSNLLKDANETIEELDAFGEYIVERIENKTKWAIEKVNSEGNHLQDKGNILYNEQSELEQKDINQEEKSISDNDINAKKQNNIDGKVNKIEEKYKKVIELYQSGMDTDQIASKLSLGKGEVRLAIRIMGGKVK